MIENLLKCCLEPDIAKRPSAEELLKIIDRMVYDNRRLF